jgi:hypothetical protein
MTASASRVINIPKIINMKDWPNRNLSLHDIELGVYAM